MRRLGVRAAARIVNLRGAQLLDVAIAAAAVVFIASPMLFTHSGFAPDFTNDIWLAGYQQHMIASHLHPTLYLQTGRFGVFSALFAFYGGTLFALTGTLAVLLGGSTVLGFEVITLAAITAAYAGLAWSARQLGVRGWLAHAPAFVFVTSAYYVTDLYGRGAWTEFMAVSALPLVIACGLYLVRASWRISVAACLVAATTVFSGSHNITLVWGSTVAIEALIVLGLLSWPLRNLPLRRIGAVAGLIVLGVALNGWTLLPDIHYANDTAISVRGMTWALTGYLNTPSVIFDPLRFSPSAAGVPALFVQVPDMALLWGLLMAPLVWRERALRPALLTGLIFLVGLLATIMSSTVWSALPQPLQLAQYAYRVQTYVTLSCAALVLVGALAVTRRRERGDVSPGDRVRTGLLGLALAVGVALCGWQLWVPDTHLTGTYFASYNNRSDALAGSYTTLPYSWNAGNDYGDSSLPLALSDGTLNFDPQQALDNGNRLRVTVILRGTLPFATNIASGPYLVNVDSTGVSVVGRTVDGQLVLVRKTPGAGPVQITLSAKLSATVLLGRLLTMLAAATLMGLLMVALLRRRRSAQAVAAA